MKKVIFCFTLMLMMFNLHASDFAGGNGTQSNPYQIANRTHLDNLRKYLGEVNSDKYYIFTANINLAGSDWVPIGHNESEAFYGTLNGNGYHISNINIGTNGTIYNYNGLFGNIYNGRIINLDIVSGNIIGKNFVGSFVGRSNGKSSIENCVNYANVTGINVVGGIVGQFLLTLGTGYISRCMNFGSITVVSESADALVGGIVGHVSIGGYSANFQMSECGNYGTINATAPHGVIGGVLGYGRALANPQNSIVCSLVIKDCVHTGFINANCADEAKSHTGGIVGSLYLIAQPVMGGVGSTKCNITTCHTNGNINGNTKVGGIVGNYGGGTSFVKLEIKDNIAAQTEIVGLEPCHRIISNKHTGTDQILITLERNYANQDMLVNGEKIISSDNTSIDGNGVLLTNLYFGPFPPAWDFSTVWKLRSDNTTLPYFKYQTVPIVVEQSGTKSATINLETASDSIVIYRQSSEKGLEYLQTTNNPSAGTFLIPFVTNINISDTILFVNYLLSGSCWAPSFSTYAIINNDNQISINDDISLKIYPNPVVDNFQISGLDDSAILILTDLSGKQILTQKILDNESVNIKHLPTGIYIANIALNGKHFSCKILKE